MIIRSIGLILVSSFILSGCSSVQRSLAVGIGSGLALGAANGAVMQSKHSGHMAIQGALIGGVIGGVVSYFVHGQLEKRDDKIRHETLFNLEKFNVLTPSQEIRYK